MKKTGEWHFPEVDVQYLKLHDDLPFLPKRMKIQKFEKLVASLHDKTEYVIHIIGNLKQKLIERLFLKNFDRVFKFNQNS